MPPWEMTPAHATIGIARFMGLCEGRSARHHQAPLAPRAARAARHLVPRSMQPHHADGQLWPAAIFARLTIACCMVRIQTRLFVYCGTHTHEMYSMYMYGRILSAPAEVLPNCTGCHILTPCLFWFFISPHLCQGIQLAWHARAARRLSWKQSIELRL